MDNEKKQDKPKLVAAPLGTATVVGETPDGLAWLIRYSKKDFTASTWKSYFPGGGNFCYRIVEKQQVMELK
jgi:hypothetical protein